MNKNINLVLPTYMKVFIRLLSISILLQFSSCKENAKSESINFAYTNDLIKETSPYLLKHAHNPVDWKAWNTLALEKAKNENKLIIVSIGYSSCHWCNVMEEESFENDSIAKLMNENFVSIKVDREERPDIDQIYISALEIMTGSSGWPLNCICLPDGRPIFGGTYFSTNEWAQVLIKLSTLYKEDPEKMIDYANKLEQGIKNSDVISFNKEIEEFNEQEIARAVEKWKPYLDFENGGEITDVKFPKANDLKFLLRYSFETKDSVLQNYVETTLTKMSFGGIFDQVGGGFSRYVIDKNWHIPHFEKMLYDNAQLSSIYSELFLVTGNLEYKNIATRTLDFVSQELMDQNGAFYSSLNADSENKKEKLEEGVYYSWTKSELQELIPDDYNLFEQYYNVNKEGFWENDKYVLFRNQSNAEFSKSNQLSLENLTTKVDNWNITLKRARAKRKKPGIDKKALTSWNALMLKSYVDGYSTFKNTEYLNIAIKNAEFLKKHQLKPDGGLYHNYINNKSFINGYSEDYAFVIEAFIALYQATFDEQWLNIAKKLMDYSLEHFYNKDSGMFYFTSDLDDALIIRKTDVIDKAIPSSNSVLAKNLFKLGHYYDDSNYRKMAFQMITNMKQNILESPTGYSNWLDLMSNYTFDYYEFVISGKNALKDLKVLKQYYFPNILIAGSMEESNIPLLKNRYSSGETYSYVCEEALCKLPETEVLKAIKQILK